MSSPRDRKPEPDQRFCWICSNAIERAEPTQRGEVLTWVHVENEFEVGHAAVAELVEKKR